MNTADLRLTVRANETDVANLAIIVSALRTAGQPFANRSHAMRHALATVAAASVTQAGSVQR